MHTTNESLRIAVVAPLTESVPPSGYGGIERSVSWLADELVKLNHDVTLYASCGSVTDARLVECSPEPLRILAQNVDPHAYLIPMLEKVFASADQYDIIHLHVDYAGFPFARRSEAKTVTTMHGRMDIPWLQPLYKHYDDIALNAISSAQRVPMPDLNWAGTVHHGLPHDLHKFRESGSDYFAFVGRIAEEKGIEQAIIIAEKSGMPLKIAAKVDPADRDYFEQVFKPLLRQTRRAEFLGELSQPEKDELMGNAEGLLFPTMCRESFGLVMIEAMACGTPVLAFNNGAVPEVIEHGVTGYIVESADEAVQYVNALKSLDRQPIRKQFENRFTVEKNANSYIELYERLLSAEEVCRTDHSKKDHTRRQYYWHRCRQLAAPRVLERNLG